MYVGSVSSEFTSGNCAKTLKKPALRRQLALCEAQAQSISLAFGFLPTAGRQMRGNRLIAYCTEGLCHIRSLTSSPNICSSPAYTLTEGGCCTASKGNCRTHLMFHPPHFCPPPPHTLSPLLPSSSFLVSNSSTVVFLRGTVVQHSASLACFAPL